VARQNHQERRDGNARRRHRMSRRGRFTIFLLLAVPLGVAGFFLAGSLGEAGSLQRATSRVDAWLDAWAVTPSGAVPPQSGVPAQILERVPSAGAGFVPELRPVAAFPDSAALGDRSFVDRVEPPQGMSGIAGPLRVEYTMDVELTERVLARLRSARSARAHAIVLDVRSGRVLAYVSTDSEAFPANRIYPAASIVKVITTAAALEHAPKKARVPCRYQGDPYRLKRSQLRPRRAGHRSSLERSLALSNNQCFAQLAVNTVGEKAMLETLDRFGWLDSPAPGHDSGSVDPVDDKFDLGRLGCGLAGCRITPLHAAQLAATLATGERIEPYWVDRVRDAEGRPLALPERPAPVRVLSEKLAEQVRSMLVLTTTRGTAKSAFRNARGRPLLDNIRVAGKTGNLSGRNPRGRYEWFIGLAPADDPMIAVAVLQVHDDLWFQRSSQIAAFILHDVFCKRSRCRAELASRYTGALAAESIAPVLLTSASSPPGAKPRK
jgi:hypothetical protein